MSAAETMSALGWQGMRNKRLILLVLIWGAFSLVSLAQPMQDGQNANIAGTEIEESHAQDTGPVKDTRQMIELSDEAIARSYSELELDAEIYGESIGRNFLPVDI